MPAEGGSSGLRAPSHPDPRDLFDDPVAQSKSFRDLVFAGLSVVEHITAGDIMAI